MMYFPSIEVALIQGEGQFRQMWSGLNEQISPAILAVAMLLILFSVLLIVSAAKP